MDMKCSDPSMTQSSIALLQERFRQLQRVKQLREERALLRPSSESERVSPTMYCYEPSRLLFHPESVPPTGPPSQGSLFFQAESQSKNTDIRAVDSPPLRSLRPANRSTVHASSDYNDSDVDTSLHL